MKIRLFLADILFWIHFAIIIAWFGLFLAPLSIWPGRITFHFYFSVVIVVHQLLWGLIIMPWAKKFRMVCFLTTLRQLLSGQRLSNPKNYDHFWLKKLSGNYQIKISHTLSTILTFFFFSLITFQYLFFQ